MYFLWFLLSLRATTKTCPFLHGSLASLHVKTGGGGGLGWEKGQRMPAKPFNKSLFQYTRLF